MTTVAISIKAKGINLQTRHPSHVNIITCPKERVDSVRVGGRRAVCGRVVKG